MGLSKSRRIQVLLVIDALFFLLEISIGYSVHSLALIADSFHMLNDVLSLCVGLWAVKVAGSKTRSKTYTYGWQRAETLGALINGVFLVALCMSIGIEAIQRFFEPQEVSHPKLVLIVGCCGLASNVFGLFLFHDHGHSHGHSHSQGDSNHEHADQLKDAEEGRKPKLNSTEAVVDESGNVEDILPQSVVANGQSNRFSKPSRINSEPPTDARGSSHNMASPRSVNSRRQRKSKTRSYSTLDGISGHPASFRNDIIAASRLKEEEEFSATDEEAEQALLLEAEETEAPGNEETPLIAHSSHLKSSTNGRLHNSHIHSQPPESGKKSGHGHSHGDLNMRGVFLHVIGDALGNIGVIATALFIWLTDFSWRFYTDPIVSLVITVIILSSAIPLCKAASRILLQAVPMGLNVDDIRADVASLPGVVSVHHLHVWQLSDTTLVASLHVRIAFEFKGEGSQRYMQIARQIRNCLHGYSIHSSTIQPEFCCEVVHGKPTQTKKKNSSHQSHSEDDSCCDQDSLSDHTAAESSDAAQGCLLDCDDECGDGGKCCTAYGNVVD